MQKFTRRKCIGLVILAGLVLFGGFYGLNAYGPTGYADFEQRHSAARQRVATAIQPVLAPVAVPSPEAERQKPRASTDHFPSPASAPAQKPVDFYRELIILNNCESVLNTNAPTLRDVLEHNISSAQFGLRQEDLETSPAGQGPIPNQEHRQSLMNVLAKGMIDARQRILPEIPARKLVTGMSPGETTSTLLRLALNRTEALFFAPAWDLKSHPLDYPLSIDLLGPLTAWRAALHQDAPRAILLLERYLEANRISQWRNITNSLGSYQAVQGLLVDLDRRGQLPLEAIARLRKALDRAIHSPALLTEMKAAYAQQQHESALDGLYARERWPPNAINSYLWHDLLSGVPEQYLNNALMPLAARAIDRATVAWVEEDDGRLESALTDLRRFMTLMNIDPSSRQGYHEILSHFEQRAFDNPFNFQENTNKTRFLLAVLGYHRAHGRYPHDVKELIPEYLDPSFTPNAEENWLILDFPATRLPVVPDKAPAPIREAIEQYRKNNEGQYPATAEALSPYLKDPQQIATMRGMFEDFPSRPILCHIRRMPDKYILSQLKDFVKRKEDFIKKHPDRSADFKRAEETFKTLSNGGSVNMYANQTLCPLYLEPDKGLVQAIKGE